MADDNVSLSHNLVQWPRDKISLSSNNLAPSHTKKPRAHRRGSWLLYGFN